MQATTTLRQGCYFIVRSGAAGAAGAFRSRRRPLMGRHHHYISPMTAVTSGESRRTIITSTYAKHAAAPPVGHATPQYMDYDTLVDMHLVTRQSFGNRPLFGTKRGDDKSIEWLSYKDFGKQVDRCRAALSAEGVKRGDAVAIISNNREEWAVCAYATYSLGGVFVPMYEEQVSILSCWGVVEKK